ncbi:MAG: hypothetical protein NPIRA02_19520 [Nitrospirales bacterium]|nr:MAG: hypothetical protein NPIRA02_19520 [Nitrospirales bacterium]
MQPYREFAVNLTVYFIFILAFLSLDGTFHHAKAIDIQLTMEQAQQALSDGRDTMEKAENVEDVASIMKTAEQKIRVGDNPEDNPCGAHAILRTRYYWLEYFGRREAAESKRQKKPIRMPESKIQEILQMPYLEVEVRLCGDEEFFAEGVDIALQQGSTMARPVDVGAAERGKKNPGDIPSYRSRFTARFAYADFDPEATSTLAVFFPDGKLINIEADLAKIR